ncbi:GNAT family N-acetyltransferase [Kitasatospora sp. NPDC050543]|uniref:GNAT family N-acetyltransferase n=1 Tax=Kitasatospora sp. NPDC050543 TaxID=3364054 RepID=UPI003789563B
MSAMELPSRSVDCGDFALRRWRAESDFRPLFQLIEESLDHLRPWMPWVARHSRETTANFLARCDPGWESGDAFRYAITRDGTLAGSISLYRAADGRGQVMGYWLHPAATGRGLATRAASALVTEAFAMPEVEYVEIVHDLANKASGAVPKRLGFSEVRREPAQPPLAPSDAGINVVWQLNRPGPARTAVTRAT